MRKSTAPIIITIFAAVSFVAGAAQRADVPDYTQEGVCDSRILFYRGENDPVAGDPAASELFISLGRQAILDK